MRQRIANLTSNILSPFLVSLVMIVLLSFTAASRQDALKWALLSLALSVLPIFLFAVYLVRRGRLDAVFNNLREQRTRVYLLAGLCAVAGYFILAYLGAPSVLLAAFIAGFATVVVFIGINLRWKISLHTGFVAGAVTLLMMLYGGMAVVAVVLVPLIAWARIELKQHSLAQAVTGALLAALIVVVVFAVFYPPVLA